MNYCKDCKYCLIEKESGWHPRHLCTKEITYSTDPVTGKETFESLPYCSEKRTGGNLKECEDFKPGTPRKTRGQHAWVKKEYAKMLEEQKNAVHNR